MPQEPKRRHSRARKGKRRAVIANIAAKVIECKNCKAPIIAHQVCKNCGYYKGKSIITKKPQKTKEE